MTTNPGEATTSLGIVPEQMLAVDMNALRYTPTIHGSYPTQLLRTDGTDASRTRERMSPRQGKSRVANSDRKRSEGRHDIGYARLGVGSGYLEVNRRTRIRRATERLVAGGKRVAQRKAKSDPQQPDRDDGAQRD